MMESMTYCSSTLLAVVGCGDAPIKGASTCSE
jgi:hypothetical protein